MRAETVAVVTEAAVTVAEEAVIKAVIADVFEEAAKEKVVEISEAAGEDNDEENETGERGQEGKPACKKTCGLATHVKRDLEPNKA